MQQSYCKIDENPCKLQKSQTKRFCTRQAYNISIFLIFKTQLLHSAYLGWRYRP